MTQEQKAKAYDKALERAKKVYNNISPENSSVKKILEKAFPELRESEDERIRKNIKVALMSVEEELADFYSTHHTSQEEFLAWLEKQGQRSQSHWNPSDEQIHAFEQVYYWYSNNFAPSEILASLYNDLKKLNQQSK